MKYNFKFEDLEKALERFAIKCIENDIENVFINEHEEHKRYRIELRSKANEEMEVQFLFEEGEIKKKNDHYTMKLDTQINFLSDSPNMTPFIQKVMNLFSESVIGDNTIN